jgi:hypothetical protein
MFDRTGSYNVVWHLAIALGVVAGLLNLPIDQPELKRDTAARDLLARLAKFEYEVSSKDRIMAVPGSRRLVQTLQ